MNFEPVRTLADLCTLDEHEVMDGYCEARPGDPEPGPNRGRANRRGWRNAQIDMGALAIDDAARQLAHEHQQAHALGRRRSPAKVRRRLRLAR
jgi:hypothetical protein